MTPRSATTNWQATARVQATVLVLDAPRTAVEALLDDARLPPIEPVQRDASGTVPVLFEFWNVSGGRMRPFGIDERTWRELAAVIGGGALGLLALGMAPRVAAQATALTRGLLTKQAEWAERTFGSYNELLVGIPDVRAPAATEASLYVCGMYTDSPFARLVDRALRFGFGKQAAFFSRSARGVEIWSASGARVAKLRHEPFASTAWPASTRPELERWLRQPLLGRTDAGKLVRSPFFRSALAEVESAASELELNEPFAFLGALAPSLRSLTTTAFRQSFFVALGAPQPVAVEPGERG
jgi:hypothetical protein